MILEGHIYEALVTDNPLVLKENNIDSKILQIPTKDGHFALHVAALNNSVQCLHYLVSLQDVDINMYNQHGRTPLHLSAFRGHLRIVHYLLSLPAIQVNQLTKGNGCSAIYLASCAKHPTIIQALLKAGADPNLVTMSNSTPLIAASFSAHFVSVQMLVDAGATPNFQNNKGYSALHIAACQGSEEIFNYLLSRNGDSSLQDIQGNTPLQLLETYKNSDSSIMETNTSNSHFYTTQSEKTEPTNDNFSSQNESIFPQKNTSSTDLKHKVPRNSRRKLQKTLFKERTRDSSTQSGSHSVGGLSEKSHETTVTEILA
ncbi:ankyrin repeat domain-containing protein 50-like [Hylaeus volcanicus]|uniref:ankyrin repeat domain-containing protein 50-like n=1 Tax=Hylaeus volcanicus TaxID=313075 RepID=UPI0023B804E1|nr:ankyrin repeat domain-containing protein 50-like [Hylaeus volcanicus]